MEAVATPYTLVDEYHGVVTLELPAADAARVSKEVAAYFKLKPKEDREPWLVFRQSLDRGTFVQVTAGTDNTCGVQMTGIAVCWGNNEHGQSTPPSGTFQQLALASSYTCGLRPDATMTCWGREVR